MATPNGKKQFDALGESWTLAYGINALCRIEDALEIVNVAEFQRVLQKDLSFSKLRTLFCCGLSPAVTEERAGEIMQELGMEIVSDMIGDTMNAAFPDAKGNAVPKPKKPKSGTG